MQKFLTIPPPIKLSNAFLPKPDGSRQDVFLDWFTFIQEILKSKMWMNPTDKSWSDSSLRIIEKNPETLKPGFISNYDVDDWSKLNQVACACTYPPHFYPEVLSMVREVQWASDIPPKIESLEEIPGKSEEK